MLILTRKIGETLVIGENGDIKITVLGIKGNQVRIGTEAPKNISIHREEVSQTIMKKSTLNKESHNEKENYAFDFDESLVDRIKQGDVEALFDMAVAAFNANRYGYALTFFQLAEKKGHVEAPDFINLIQEIVNKNADKSH